MAIKFDPAAELCLVAYSNCSFPYVLYYEDVDISGYTFYMSIRDENDIEVLAPSVLVIDGPSGEFRIDITSVDMSGLSPKAYVYDIRYRAPAGDYVPFLYGSFTVKQGRGAV